MDNGLTNVLANTEAWKRRVIAAIHATAERKALEGEDWMKTNARWTDRTGHARQGLFGKVTINPTHIIVWYAHTMSYGVALELARSGKYAILKPAAKKFQPEFMKEVKEVAGA